MNEPLTRVRAPLGEKEITVSPRQFDDFHRTLYRCLCLGASDEEATLTAAMHMFRGQMPELGAYRVVVDFKRA